MRGINKNARFFEMFMSEHVVLKKNNRILVILCFICLLLHTMMLVWAACKDSPTRNEVQHLVAGISHWRLGRFELFQVNPPLIRMVAAIPVLAAHPKTNWCHYDLRPGRRSERIVANDFFEANQQRTFLLITLARLACIPFSLLGAVFCFQWSRELYGIGAGTLALALWCFSPAILGHGHLITADVGAAALGVAAAYMFWRWLRWQTWWASLGAGIALGFAESVKTTWIVLFVLWPILWFTWRLLQTRTQTAYWLVREFGQMLVILFSALCILNVCYGFEGTFRQLGKYEFISESLGGPRDPLSLTWERNRFTQGCFTKIPLPLPKDYLMGIDVQRGDFERGLPSYLRGEWADHGWWYYYLYALAVKVPLGTWCLLILAIGVTIFGRGYNASWRDEMVVLVPGLAILIFVSSQTGFSVHSRYVIPALPFFFIWISKVARVFEKKPFTKKRWIMAIAVALALMWSVTSSLLVYPHSLSYFNELAGGPENGAEHLLDSNIDWGQDLFYLKDWLDEHPEVTLDGLAFFSSYPATLANISETPYPLPGPPDDNSTAEDDYAQEDLGPKPGWFALSVNEIYSRSKQYRYFLKFKPVSMAGYSIYIYHITLEDANRVRRKLGLPELDKTETKIRENKDY